MDVSKVNTRDQAVKKFIKGFREYLRSKFHDYYGLDLYNLKNLGKLRDLRGKLRCFFMQMFGMTQAVYEANEGALGYIILNKNLFARFTSLNEEGEGIQVDKGLIKQLKAMFGSRPSAWKKLSKLPFMT
mmetsp:Transcript_258/g.466  ORF Transcript_258/g.466 Transcript_258/m.466 type:complete len:129 (+) Transcript_258:421-807(+)|eukprot:CAMPEP_0168613214 /NCGR_PEP_ID=MMETSP0449_2-20121227/3334_1 /TAXON_ID=1082188 /ORGANISM="Strombidium rassoulzadegani, Strain ras09" /LENGTH=128 /DNA_ID=CAMNT_0008653837 /DNA_START=338 /DNA_END=724 /DNA_ORIENTATION=+